MSTKSTPGHSTYTPDKTMPPKTPMRVAPDAPAEEIEKLVRQSTKHDERRTREYQRRGNKGAGQ